MSRKHRARRHAMAVAHAMREDHRDGRASQRRAASRSLNREKRAVGRALLSIERAVRAWATA